MDMTLRFLLFVKVFNHPLVVSGFDLLADLLQTLHDILDFGLHPQHEKGWCAHPGSHQGDKVIAPKTQSQVYLIVYCHLELKML